MSTSHYLGGNKTGTVFELGAWGYLDREMFRCGATALFVEAFEDASEPLEEGAELAIERVEYMQRTAARIAIFVDDNDGNVTFMNDADDSCEEWMTAGGFPGIFNFLIQESVYEDDNSPVAIVLSDFRRSKLLNELRGKLAQYEVVARGIV